MTQAEGVRDHGQAAEAHGGSRDHRIKLPMLAQYGDEEAGGQRDAEAIVGKGQGEILADVAEHAAAQPLGPFNSGDVTASKGDRSSFDRHIAAGPHRHADIGCGEGWSIVDSITRHGNPVASCLEGKHTIMLGLWGEAGCHAVDAQLFRYDGGGVGMVTS